MSNAAMTWAAGLHPGRGAKAVLMCLADRATDHSGEDWTCFPSIESIMSWTDDSRSSVERHLKRLEALGFISRVRRRRVDGRLGIYDYTLHREADRRAQLQAARSGVDAALEPESPDVNLTAGPDVNLTGAIRQNGPSPHVKLTGLEPSGEPLREPSPGAREPGDHGFDALAELWPDSGGKRTNWGQARAAWARACGLEPPERLLAAARACATDPDLARGDYGWPGLHTWLAEERWRAFVPKPPPAAGAAPRAFAGPPELAAQLRALGGDVDKFLAGAVWREADRTIVTVSGWSRDGLVAACGGRALSDMEIRVERAERHDG